MSNLPAIRKTIAALVGAVLTWAAVVVTSEPAAITASEWLLAAGSIATAAGVYGVTNEPAPGGDRGQVVQVLLVVILVIVILALLGNGR